MYRYTLEKVISPTNTLEDINLLNNLLSNAECVHTTLGKLFNVDKEVNWRTKYNILYKRLLQNTCKFIVQSDIEIDMSKAKIMNFNVEKLSEQKVRDNDIIKIDMYLSPFRKNTSNSKRKIIKKQEDRIEWVKNKLSHNNECEIIECNEVHPVMTYMEHSEQLKGKEMLLGYCYEATIKINSTNEFSKIAHNGIGPCKNYGFGLIDVI